MADPDPEREVEQGAEVLRAGGIIAYPTEAVYGLGCDPGNAGAVARLLEMKRRPVAKGVILIAADLTQLRPYIQPLSEAQTRQVMAHWPGPVTWLLPARAEVPRWLRGDSPAIAVRLTAHPLAAALCRQFGGALVSTSANRGGEKPCRTPDCVRQEFAAEVDCVVAGELGSESRPSRILDLVSGTVVRD